MNISPPSSGWKIGPSNKPAEGGNFILNLLSLRNAQRYISDGRNLQKCILLFI
jgi:hypothetical protein